MKTSLSSLIVVSLFLAVSAETARNRLTTISEDRDVFICLLRQSVALDAEMAAALSHRTHHCARRPRVGSGAARVLTQNERALHDRPAAVELNLDGIAVGI